MRYVQEETRFVSGLPQSGDSAGGDPSPWTAIGCFLGIEAAVQSRLDVDTVKGLRVAAVDLKDVRERTPAKATVIRHTLGHFVENEDIRRWSTPVDRVYALLQAAKTIIAGGRGVVKCFDAEDGKRLWNDEVDGQVRNMCIVSGRLIVSTTEGQITCYTPVDSASPQAEINVRQRTAKPLLPAGHGGYCLVAGEYDLKALTGLAQSFDLVVYAMTDGDPVAGDHRQYGGPARQDD